MLSMNIGMFISLQDGLCSGHSSSLTSEARAMPKNNEIMESEEEKESREREIER